MSLHIDTDLLIGDALEKGEETKEKVLNPRTGALILEVAEASTDRSTGRSPRRARRSIIGR